MGVSRPGFMLTVAVLGTGLGGEATVSKTRVVGGALPPVGGGQQESAQRPVGPKRGVRWCQHGYSGARGSAGAPEAPDSGTAEWAAERLRDPAVTLSTWWPGPGPACPVCPGAVLSQLTSLFQKLAEMQKISEQDKDSVEEAVRVGGPHS